MSICKINEEFVPRFNPDISSLQMQFAKDGDEAEEVLGDLSYVIMEDVGRFYEF